MPKKSTKVRSAEKELKATVASLRRSLEKAEARADRWKGRAKKHQSTAKASTSRVAKLEKRLAAAVAPAPAPSAPSGPDGTWTVTRLRAEARARGVAGYSRKTKAQLLADLS